MSAYYNEFDPKAAWRTAKVFRGVSRIDSERPGAVMVQGCCFEYMKRVETKRFNLCVTSPPYNMNLRVSATNSGHRYHSRQIVPELSTKYTSYPDNLPMDEYEAMLTRLARETTRCCDAVFMNVQTLTGNKPAFMRFLGANADIIKEVIVWDKVVAQPAIGAGVLNSQFEWVVVLSDTDAATRAFKQAQFPRGRETNVWRIGREHKPRQSHGAQFPRELVRRVLANFSTQGAHIFDPMMGVGTAAGVATSMGRNFTGVELDPDYHAAGVAYLEHELGVVPVVERVT